ncbi:hypothetical protein MYXA107069_37225 [Myxococcus xanthus]
MGRVVHGTGLVPPGGAGEVPGQFGVHRVQRRLHRLSAGAQDVPGPALHGHRVSPGEDEGLAAGGVQVRGENLRLPGAAPDVTQQKFVGLEGGLGRLADGAFGRLAHHQLEGLVAAEVHLLGVAVRARLGQQTGEAKEDAHPPLAARGGDIGGDAGDVHRAVHRLPGAEEDALPEVVVGARRGRQVHGEVGDGGVRRRHRPGDDAVDAQVRGEAAVRLLQLREGQIQLGLRNLLPEVKIQPVAHACALQRKAKAWREKSGTCRRAFSAASSSRPTR